MIIDFHNYLIHYRGEISWVPNYAETAGIFYMIPRRKSISLTFNFKDIIDGNIKITSILGKKGVKNKFSNGKKKCIFDPKIHQKYLDRSIEFAEGLKNEKFKVTQNGV